MSDPQFPNPLTSPKAETITGTPSFAFDPVVSAAWLYYHQRLTQAEIAEMLKISRSSVVNLLNQARERGVVQIRLDPDALLSMDLAVHLKQHFQLQDALIIPHAHLPHSSDAAGSDRQLAARMVGEAGALYLHKVLREGDTLAVGWGVTMLHVAQALTVKSVVDLTVAQLIGGFSTADAFNPSKVASLFADKLKAQLYHLYTPAFVASSHIRDILLSDPAIALALNVAKQARLAVIGIGRASFDDTIIKAGFLTSEQMDSIKLKGAVGNIISHYFDIYGNPVVTDLDDHLTSPSLEDLRAIPTVIGVGEGKTRAPALLGALRGRYIDVLITDIQTAQEVLELARTHSA